MENKKIIWSPAPKFNILSVLIISPRSKQTQCPEGETGPKDTKVKGFATGMTHQGRKDTSAFASESFLYLQETAHSYIKGWDIVGVCLNLFDSLGRKQLIATSSCAGLYLDPTLPPESLLGKGGMDLCLRSSLSHHFQTQ